MSSRVVCLDVTSPCNLQLIPLYGCPSLEFVSHELDTLLLENISHVEELLHFVDPVQELYIKVPAKRRNLNLHHIFIRTWVSALPASIRVRKSASPGRVLKSASPILIRISESPLSSIGKSFIFLLAFKVISLVEGIVQLFLVGEFIKLIIPRKMSRWWMMRWWVI